VRQKKPGQKQTIQVKIHVSQNILLLFLHSDLPPDRGFLRMEHTGLEPACENHKVILPLEISYHMLVTNYCGCR